MAIKVGGTTVIDDSRALSNIASVDATTATAIGAAGVGGSTVFLGTTSITSDVDYIDIPFTSGYKAYRIHINNLRNTKVDDQLPIRARFTNSSNALITAEEYVYTKASETSTSRETAFRFDILIPSPWSTVYQVDQVVMVYDPLSSDFATQGSWIANGAWQSNIQTGYTAKSFDFGMMKPYTTNALRVYLDSPTYRIDSTSSGYSVWGIK